MFMTMILNSLSAKHFLLVLVPKQFYKAVASVRQQTHDSLRLSTFTQIGLFILSDRHNCHRSNTVSGT